MPTVSVPPHFPFGHGGSLSDMPALPFPETQLYRAIFKVYSG